MKKLCIALLILTSAAFAQGQFSAWGIGGFGVASDVSQCAPPATNYANLCPVVGGSAPGWYWTANGSPYASWQGPKGKDGIDGQTPSLSVGTVVSGSPAAVSMGGTQLAPTLNFVLQPGQPGTPGVAVGCKVTYNNQCPKPTGVNQNGCVMTITAVSCQ